METKYIVEFGLGNNKFWLKDSLVWDLTFDRREAKKFTDFDKAKKCVESPFALNLNGHVTEY